MNELRFKEINDQLAAGLIITDPDLQIVYANDFALKRVLGLKNVKADLNFRDFVLYTTDLQEFDMQECMSHKVAQDSRSFHKTLIVKNQGEDRLVYFSAKRFVSAEQKGYVFTITDISDEMDCIMQTPGIFGKGEFVLHQRLIGHDQKIREIYRMISLAADSEVNVLILGESGTGKELVADAIHELSARKGKPFVKVNCAALSDSLLESELFGHVKGAFTGAYRDKTGKFEQANGGTLFLDEIGEISLSLQVKLLRVIQERIIERVGDNKSIRIDLRLVAATNKNLRELIAQGLFREDLFYRLSVFNILMPPLRQRYVDIPLLTNHFVEKFNKSYGKNVKGVSRSAMQLMMDYSWPGNIRELQNAIEHAFVLVRGNLIEAADLPADIRHYTGSRVLSLPAPTAPSGTLNLDIRKNSGGRLNISRDQLEQHLQDNNWNQSLTAEKLGISRVALWKKMKKMGL